MARRGAGSWWAVAAACCASVLLALLLPVDDRIGWSEIGSGPVALSAMLAVGYSVLAAALRTTGRAARLAWVLLATGISRAAFVLCHVWAAGDVGLSTRTGAVVSSWIGFVLLLVAPVLAPLSLLWFPDGHLPDRRRRWRIAQVLTGGALAALAAILALSWRYRGKPLLDDTRGVAGLTPEQGIHGRLFLAAVVLALVLTLVGLVLGVLSLWTRWRQASQGAVRQQLKWYLAGVVAAVLLNVTGNLLAAVVLNLLGTVTFFGCLLIAVVRHDLWSIDRILNRTVVYGLVSAVVASVYAGSVVGLGLLLEGVGRGGAVAAAVAALAAATVAGPVRRAAQSAVDRRFERRKFDAVALVREHLAQTALAVPVPGSLEELLARVLRDPTLRVSYACRDGRRVDSWGHPWIEAPEGQPARRQSSPAGWTVLHAEVPTAEQALHAAVLMAAAPGLARCRLQAELLVQVAEAEQSRRRVVEAAGIERRRIERNLHDGAQQRLVSLALRVRSEQRRRRADVGQETDRLLDVVVDELRGAVEDLRALAAGVLPGSLVSEGLGPALEEMADRHPRGVQVTNTLDHRHASADEVAWFVASEGIANAAKHAQDSRVRIDVRCCDGRLRLQIVDDGPGGAVEGAGLTGLQDRVRASSGQLTLASPQGNGTVLSVVLPCA